MHSCKQKSSQAKLELMKQLEPKFNGMVNENKFNVNDVRCFKRKLQKVDGYMDDSRTFTAFTVKNCVSVHTTHIGS